jgi:hypothetical protein
VSEWNDAIEAAASVCDARAATHEEPAHPQRLEAHKCGLAIRALKRGVSAPNRLACGLDRTAVHQTGGRAFEVPPPPAGRSTPRGMTLIDDYDCPTQQTKEPPMSQVRAKFTVSCKKIWSSTEKGQSGEVVLAPVYSTDPNHENKAFWDATPNGAITLGINNPPAFAAFELGQEYYVDFTRA